MTFTKGYMFLDYPLLNKLSGNCIQLHVFLPPHGYQHGNADGGKLKYKCETDMKLIPVFMKSVSLFRKLLERTREHLDTINLAFLTKTGENTMRNGDIFLNCANNLRVQHPEVLNIIITNTFNKVAVVNA
jgi:hypothetical protein